MSKNTLLLLKGLLLLMLLAPGAMAQSDTSESDETSDDGDRKPGITVIVQISGKADVIEPGGQAPVAAKKDMQVPVGATLVTGPGTVVDLALSNGALLQVQENSRFTIGEFEQESYQFVFNNGATLKPAAVQNFEGGEAVLNNLDASAEAFNELEAEPTSSQSKFILDYGTLVGSSKRLAPGSSMEIVTPVGVAGIRGTIFQLSIVRTGAPGSNTFSVTLNVPQGSVQFGNSAGTQSVTVNAGRSLNLSATVNANGAVTIGRLTNTQMTPLQNAVLAQIVRAVIQVQTVFTAIQATPEVLVRVNAANEATRQQQQQNQGNQGGGGGEGPSTPSVIPQSFAPGGSGATVVPVVSPR